MVKAETVIGPVSIAYKPHTEYLGIRFETPFEGMFAIVTQELKVLRKWVKESHISEDGPFFLRYYHCDMKSLMDGEVGLVTNSGLPDQDCIKSGFLPQGKYATLIYRGNGLRGNQALMKWARENRAQFDPQIPDLANRTCADTRPT